MYIFVDNMLIDEYLEYQLKFEKKYGFKTIVLIQLFD